MYNLKGTDKVKVLKKSNDDNEKYYEQVGDNLQPTKNILNQSFEQVGTVDMKRKSGQKYDHEYVFAVSELTANRTITLPLLTNNDEFVFKNHTQTLSNKTLSSSPEKHRPLAHLGVLHLKLEFTSLSHIGHWPFSVLCTNTRPLPFRWALGHWPSNRKQQKQQKTTKTAKTASDCNWPVSRQIHKAAHSERTSAAY